MFAILPLLASPAEAQIAKVLPAEVRYTIDGDAIPDSLTGASGSSERGRLIVGNRQKSLCVLCHTGLIADPHQQGNLGPSLKGVGSRLTEAQLRLRIVDSSRLNPQTIMPSYLRTDDLTNVAPRYRDRSLLSPQDIEDVIAYLVTLKE